MQVIGILELMDCVENFGNWTRQVCTKLCLDLSIKSDKKKAIEPQMPTFIGNLINTLQIISNLTGTCSLRHQLYWLHLLCNIVEWTMRMISDWRCTFLRPYHFFVLSFDDLKCLIRFDPDNYITWWYHVCALNPYA